MNEIFIEAIALFLRLIYLQHALYITTTSYLPAV